VSFAAGFGQTNQLVILGLMIALIGLTTLRQGQILLVTLEVQSGRLTL
jgi:hypothetical protein